MCKSLNSFAALPKSYKSSVLGTILLANLPTNEISSPVASPRVTAPLRTVLPATSNAPLASISPVNVDIPETLKFPSPVVLTPETVKLPNTLAPTPRVSKRFKLLEYNFKC